MVNRITRPLLGVLCLLTVPAVSLAEGFSKPTDHLNLFTAALNGRQEVPAVITDGVGAVALKLIPGEAIRYALKYDTEGEVLQAHIHIGQRGANGGVAAFLCSNLDSAPPGVPPCSQSPGVVEGVIRPSDVIGPAEQGVEPGELGELMSAIRKGLTYVNVHTDRFPPGEVRGKLRGRRFFIKLDADLEARLSD